MSSFDDHRCKLSRQVQQWTFLPYARKRFFFFFFGKYRRVNVSNKWKLIGDYIQSTCIHIIHKYPIRCKIRFRGKPSLIWLEYIYAAAFEWLVVINSRTVSRHKIIYPNNAYAEKFNDFRFCLASIHRCYTRTGTHTTNKPSTGINRPY